MAVKRYIQAIFLESITLYALIVLALDQEHGLRKRQLKRGIGEPKMKNKAQLDLIDRNALIEKAYFHGKFPDSGNLYPDGKEAVDVDDIEDMPSVAVVSRGLYEQIKWERDIALEQLESYGISLGSNAEVVKVVHGEWEIVDFAGNMQCSVCGKIGCKINDESNYCPNCGADMR